MYTKSRVVIVFAVMALLVFSTQSALADFSNGPENPGGAIVFRDEIAFFSSTEDYKAGLTAIYNLDMVEYCSGNYEPGVFMEIQDIDIPAHELREIVKIHGEEIPTTVWPFAVEDWNDPGYFCPLFLNNDPLATGTARFRFTDNDFNAPDYQDNKNVNSGGFTSQGWLEGPDGELMRFNSVYRVVWDGVNGDKVFNVTSKINLK